MKKATQAKATEVVEPRLINKILAAIIIVGVLAMSVFWVMDMFSSMFSTPQKYLIVMLEGAKFTAALLPILIGLTIFSSAKGSWQRRLVVASVYMGIYVVVQGLFAAYVPTFIWLGSIFGDAYRYSGINFFVEFAIGAIVSLGIYFATKKRTMTVNKWPTLVAMIISAAIILLTVWAYYATL